MTKILYTLFLIESKLATLFQRIMPRCRCLEHKFVVQRFVNRLFGQFVKKYAYQATATSQQSDYIWLFWWQGEEQMPTLVKSCYERIKAMSNGKKVVLLHQHNFSQYADIPDYIIEKVQNKQISLTHFSDILRVALLSKFGGWWLDATIYPTRPIESRNSFYTIRLKEDDSYISKAQWSGFLWYMPQNHPLANFLYQALLSYWKTNDTLCNYFLLDHLIRLYVNRNPLFAQDLAALPMENENCYFFQSDESNALFDQSRWSELCSKNRFFKCSWKLDKSAVAEDSFYKKILINN